MKFLDRKEQVLDIQLTQHGKRMLAQGVLKPHYYAFYDDDIIYDVEWAGHSEDQNDARSPIISFRCALSTTQINCTKSY